MKIPFRIRFWPTGIIVFAVAFVATNLAFVTVAVRHQPQLVSEHYYNDGFNLRQIAEQKAKSDATGWSARVRCMPMGDADRPLVEVSVSDARNLPCDSLSGTAAFYRPSNKTLDVAALPLQYVGTGRYFVVLPRRLERGAWQVLAHLARGAQESEIRLNLFAE